MKTIINNIKFDTFLPRSNRTRFCTTAQGIAYLMACTGMQPWSYWVGIRVLVTLWPSCCLWGYLAETRTFGFCHSYLLSILSCSMRNCLSLSSRKSAACQGNSRTLDWLGFAPAMKLHVRRLWCQIHSIMMSCCPTCSCSFCSQQPND